MKKTPWEEIPIVGSIRDDDLMESLESAMADQDVCMQRDRPYKGQSWTDSGLRGMTKVEGLTMRDIRDCFVRGACLAAGESNPAHYAEAEKGESAKLNKDTLYELDWSKIDPGAVAQNMACEIERMMGIFPNIKE